MSDAAALTAIQNQTVSSRPNDVFVIEVLSVRFPQFTLNIQQELERYQFMQMMTFNSCGIKSLSFFPSLPGLIRLDLVRNQITGGELVHLQGCRHLQTIMLGGNQIDKTDDLGHLKGMKQLFQLNFLGNPIQSEAGYRNKVFTLFPSLTVLDGLDKGGKDAFNATSMVNTTSRVPSSLFDTSKPVPSTSIFSAPSPISGTGLFSSVSPSRPIPARSVSPKPRTKTVSVPKVAKSGKAGKAGKSGKGVASTTGSRSMSTRAGLIFPVGRIRRHLKTNDPHNRLTKGASVFLAGVLEYLACEVMQQCGTLAKRQKKARITPKMIRQVVENDSEMKQAISGAIIPREQ